VLPFSHSPCKLDPCHQLLISPRMNSVQLRRSSVPKILEAKSSRQILIVTHNGNIPVLGDANYVLKIENRPRADLGPTYAPNQCWLF
jgi:hypothetical protein